MKENWVKICPKCGSTNIRSHVRGFFTNAGTADQDNCKDCGYNGTTPEIKESEIRNFRKELEKNKK